MHKKYKRVFSINNDLGYRTEQEYAQWRRRCPLDLYRARLIRAGTLNEVSDRAIAEKVELEIEKAFLAARSASFPDPNTASLRVYA